MSWATQQLTSRGLTACRNATKYSASTALAVLSLAVAQPAWAQTTNPNPPPPPVSVPFIHSAPHNPLSNIPLRSSSTTTQPAFRRMRPVPPRRWSR